MLGSAANSKEELDDFAADTCCCSHLEGWGRKENPLGFVDDDEYMLVQNVEELDEFGSDRSAYETREVSSAEL